jgi:hypothetical protein
MTRMPRITCIGLLVFVTLIACSRTEQSDLPATPDIARDPLAEAVEAFEKAQQELARVQLQRGYQCGWQQGYTGQVAAARKDGPARFRSDALGTAYAWGVIFLVMGFLGTFGLAWLLPRLRRRPKPPTRERTTPPTWSRWFIDLSVQFLKRIGRLLRVESFDPTLANERQRCGELLHESERQLDIALHSLKSLAAERPERGAVLLTRLSATLESLRALRRRLEGPGTLPTDLTPDHLAPRIERTSQALRDFRLRLERLAIERRLTPAEPAPAAAPAQTSPDAAPSPTPKDAIIDARWSGLEAELGNLPELPDERRGPDVALAPWVRKVGIIGLIALTLSLPMLSAWMTAGAFPLFFAFLFAFGGLSATVLARVHLHRAGHLPLLQGFSDRIARWLTGVTALALAVTMVSSWMSTESGLDLGDPPPVPMPDPKLLEAPRLWKDIGLMPKSAEPSPKAP